MHFIDKSNSNSNYSLSNLKNCKNLRYDGVCVKQHLVEVYGLRCCYCESLITSATYFQVDHFYPQSMKQPYCDDVENYHLSCPRCNSNKSDKLNNLSPNYYYDLSVNKWALSSPRHFSKHIRYLGPTINSPTGKYDIFIQNLLLNGYSGSEKRGFHLALIDARAAYLLETQFLLTTVSSLLKKNALKEAFALLLFYSNRFKKNAQYSTMIVNNYGCAMKIILQFLKKKGCAISLIINNILL